MTLNTLVDKIIKSGPLDVVLDAVIRKQYITACIDVVKKKAMSGVIGDFAYRQAVARFEECEKAYANRGFKTEAPETVMFWCERGLLDALGRRRDDNHPFFYASKYYQTEETCPVTARDITFH